MLTVTEPAKQELKRILFERVDHPLAGVRLVKGNQPDSYGLTIDIELPGDQVVEYDGSKILLVGQDISTCLDGDVLDIEDEVQGKNFVVVGKK